MKLRTLNRVGLQITVPLRFNLGDIPAILEEHKTWIINQLELLQQKMLPSDTLPDCVEFRALNESWKIYYVDCQSRIEMIERPHYEIVLTGDIKQSDLCRRKLGTWIRNYSREFLVSQLQELSLQTGLEYQTVTVRDQKTVWGSCTSRKSINLNYKLIFLPYHLLRHIIIHELCHTRYLNHSRRFWDLVSRHDAEWQKHRRQMRSADQHIPGWL